MHALNKLNKAQHQQKLLIQQHKDLCWTNNPNMAFINNIKIASGTEINGLNFEKSKLKKIKMLFYENF